MIHSALNVPVDLTELAKQTMLKYDLLPDLPQAAQKELNEIQSPVVPVLSSIKDLRDKLWFSVDNDDSRDLDQVTYAEQTTGQKPRIYIAIADVDSLVKKDSALDLYAQHNTTSVYTPTKVFSMLPEKLSTNLTSLNENEDRLAIVAEVTIGPDGSLEEHKHYRAYICNKAKLAYNSLAAWLDGKAPIPPIIPKVKGLEEQIKFQDSLAQLLKEYRHKQGALTLDTIEPHVVIKDNQVINIKAVETNRASHLIEDFMIAANTASALFMRDNTLPSLRRIVRVPKRWDRIVEIAKEYGENLPADPDAKALDLFLIKRRLSDPLRFPDLSLTVIKLLGNGEYVVEYPGDEPIGHFSLAVKNYTHSTAPNRRYSDIINQRILKAIFDNKPTPYKPKELEALAQRCTNKEDDAEKVERQMKKSAAIVLLSSKINHTFDCLVTGAGIKGTWVRIFDPPVEGKLVQGFEKVDVGNQIKVRLVHVDLEKGFIDFVKI